MKTKLLSAIVFLTAVSILKAQTISTVAGNGTAGYSGDGGQATAAEFDFTSFGSSIAGVATDAAGNLYVSEYNGQRIRKINTSGVITTFAGSGTAGYAGDGGQATAAQISYPTGVATDAAGNVYIADNTNYRVRKVAVNGIITTVAGVGTNGFSGDGGPATSAQLAALGGIATDAVGNLYIADQQNNCIRKVTTNGIINTVAGNLTPGSSGDGGAATAALLQSPSAVAVDATGNLYIVDYGNSRVRVVNTSGVISTFAGGVIHGFSGDGGLAVSAELYYPTDVKTDAYGNVFIADMYNDVIRKVDAAGNINTIAGIGEANGYSGDGGSATLAELNQPYGIALDAAGNMYIGDAKNYRIRKVTNARQAGIAQYKKDNSMGIYPNPACNNIQVTGINEGVKEILVTDVLGKTINQFKIQGTTTSIDISSLSSGVYFIKTNQGTQKFIKE